ncbi:hypothetical protein [Absicoccus porci]|jgi:hypothetical protein|uniref:hypothetical protein n=1 Tax=Absicoccus porci TaxID=2486576 RepID=UPI003D944BBF
MIVMVSEDDGTKSDMIPQIEELRNDPSYLFTNRNLIYWENVDGGHDLDSLEMETNIHVILIKQDQHPLNIG